MINSSKTYDNKKHVNFPNCLFNSAMFCQRWIYSLMRGLLTCTLLHCIKKSVTENTWKFLDR